MEISPIILFIGGLAVMFFGYFFGLFEGRGQGRKRALAEFGQKEKQEILEQPVPPAPVAPAGPPDDPGLLRIKEDEGFLRLELDGSPVDTTSISLPERRRLIEIVTRMRPWLEPRQPAPAASPAPRGAEPLAPRPVSMPSAPSAPGVPAVASAEPPVPTPSSMIAQIDDILQKNIAGTPLAGRGVRILDAPGGGVVVLVGLQRYPSVSDVPDADIQAALRAAIAAWEQRYTPGL